MSGSGMGGVQRFDHVGVVVDDLDSVVERRSKGLDTVGDIVKSANR
jgi:hypothetical protein